ncbi:hypothetical protein [Rhodanobacter sp. B04]|uniref:hypothetical protein n=1 Tax=Rhodanobacter sp. B04 TaxID=1945860 RepID=UPI001115A109|nr:hypothetical protein [Rhodanobacter sp. B04]
MARGVTFGEITAHGSGTRLSSGHPCSLVTNGILFVLHLDLASDGKMAVTLTKTYAEGLSESPQTSLANALKRSPERSSVTPETVDGQAVAATEVLYLQVNLQSRCFCN